MLWINILGYQGLAIRQLYKKRMTEHFNLFLFLHYHSSVESVHRKSDGNSGIQLICQKAWLHTLGANSDSLLRLAQAALQIEPQLSLMEIQIQKKAPHWQTKIHVLKFSWYLMQILNKFEADTYIGWLILFADSGLSQIYQCWSSVSHTYVTFHVSNIHILNTLQLLIHIINVYQLLSIQQPVSAFNTFSYLSEKTSSTIN